MIIIRIFSFTGISGKSVTANSHRSRPKGFHANDPYMKGSDVGVGRTQCLKYKTQDLYNNPHIQWPLKGYHKDIKSDAPQILNYTTNTAVLRILLEHGYNYTVLYDLDVQLIIENLNITQFAFEKDTNETFHTQTIPFSRTISSPTNNNLERAKSKFPFITEHNVLSILYEKKRKIEDSVQSNLRTPNEDTSTENKSKLVLLERTKYPRHCKNLHNPAVIQVKVIHTQ